jgi:hypothetical protein
MLMVQSGKRELFLMPPPTKLNMESRSLDLLLEEVNGPK